MAEHIFDAPLVEAKFIKRYKRFFVDAAQGGDVLTAHCANTGSMKGLLLEGARCYLRDVNDPKRKLRYSFEMIDGGNALVGVNTSLPNSLVYDALMAKEIDSLSAYSKAKREVKYGKEGKSRIDVLLTEEGLCDCYVEVKNVTLAEEGVAKFPDAVTSRGLKHLEELALEVKKGNRAVMFYLVQRSDCSCFKPAVDIDPAYCAKLKEVVEQGVEVLCYQCLVSPERILLDKPLPVLL